MIRIKNSVFSRQRKSGKPGALRILAVSNFEELKTHSEAWDNLALRVPQRLPMLSYAWISSFLEYQCQSEDSWICLMVYDGPSLIGVLPVFAKCCRFLGKKSSEFLTPFNWHTPCVDLLVESGHEQEVIPLLLSKLRASKPALKKLTFRRLADCSPVLENLNNGSKGYFPVCRFNGYGSFIKVSGGFEKYRAGLNPKFSRNLRRLDRRLELLPNVEYSFITGKHDTNHYFDMFLKVEASCWKGNRGTAIAQSPQLKKFYSSLVDKLARLGWLEWHFLSTEGKPMAANLAIRVNKKLVLLKIAYDTAFSSYSPGNKLFEKMLQRAFESGEIDEIDCLSEYDWNKNWNMTTRAYYDLSIYPAHPAVFMIHYLPHKLLNLACRVPLLRRFRHLLSSKALNLHIGPINQVENHDDSIKGGI